MKEFGSDELIKQFFYQQKEIYGFDGIFLEKVNIQEVLSTMKKQEMLEEMVKMIKKCKKCVLGLTRLNPVPGEGEVNTKLMFVGEGPGYEEDHQGKPFVGRAGELLTRIINYMGFKRDEVYITNIVKCHPMKIPDPELRNNDRPPNDEEISKCLPYLEEQIKIIKPKIICCLGSIASRVLTQSDIPISELRGKIFKYYKDNDILVIPTYHPAALLRNPELKKLVKKDVDLIVKLLSTKS